MKFNKISWIPILALCFSLFCCSVALAYDPWNGGAYQGTDSSGVPTSCSAPNAYQLLCFPNGISNGAIGGSAWHVYKTGQAGPSKPPEHTDIYQGSIIYDIEQKCSAANGYDGYVAYGWVGMNDWNIDGYRSKYGGGPILLGPMNYGLGDTIAGALPNETNALNPSGYTPGMDIPNNTRITKGLARQLYCDGKDDAYGSSYCNFEAEMYDKGYFCFKSKKNKLTIKYTGEEEITKYGCYGTKTVTTRTVVPHVKQKVKDNEQNKDTDTRNRYISFESAISELATEDPAWEYLGIDKISQNGVDITESGGSLVSVAGNTVKADVLKGDVEVVLRFQKKIEKENTKPCDPECESWVPESYENSDAFDGETSVRIGIRNTSLKGYNDNEKWHHDSEVVDGRNGGEGIMQGVIYAKPTDDVQWKYCYYPGVERAANEQVTPDANAPKHPEPTTMSPTVNQLNNKEFHEIYSGWNSTYRAWTEELKEDEDEEWSESLTPGDDKVLIGTLPGGPIHGGDLTGAITTADGRMYPIQPRDQLTLHRPVDEIDGKLDPGDILKGHIETKDGYTKVHRDEESVHTWNCNAYTCGCNSDGTGCTTCYETCSHDSNYYPSSANKNHKQDDARVVVPYNYKNSASAEIVTSSTTEYLYSGETVTVKNPRATVGLRKNEQTDGDREDGYATQVESGKARLVAFLMDPQDYEADEGSVWNGGTKRDDGYENVLESDDEGNLWQSTDEVCGTNGSNNALNAKWGVCKYLETFDGRLNENSSLDGATYDFAESKHYHSTEDPTDTQKIYNVFDEAVGNYFCVASAIYPFSVKGDTEEEGALEPEGDQTWYISKPSCIKIAKRPTFQVWGGGIFSASDVETSVSIKNNLLDVNGTHDTSNGYQKMTTGIESNLGWFPTSGTQTLFGSWGELSLTVGGRSEKTASGAGTGYRNGYGGDGSPWNKDTSGSPDVGKGLFGGAQGDAVSNFCLRSPLSIGNMNCNNGTGWIGGFSSSALLGTLTSDKQDLLERFPEDGAGESYEITHNSEVGGITLANKKTIINLASGTATINGNITYSGTGLKTLQDVPKYILYSPGDINIKCNVTRIDAILIADGKVNTCGDHTAEGTGTYDEIEENDTNNSERSKQLVINGAVVAGSVVLPRSYGAGTGIHSITPAELINYDSSIYLWANGKAEGMSSGYFTETASRELAPRY